MRNRTKIKFLTILLISCFCTAAYSEIVFLKKFTFNEDQALKRWKNMIFNGKVNYELVKQGESGYVLAKSEKSSSALYYRIGFKLKKYPLLAWKWKVLQFPDITNAENEEEKDDYAARVYVIFPFLTFSTSKFLEYIWAKDIPVETIVDTPSAKNVKKIIVRSGRAKKGEWISESRNVYEDYIRAFGKKPRLGVGAIAIMCDADGSETSAEALFDDILIESAAEGLTGGT